MQISSDVNVEVGYPTLAFMTADNIETFCTSVILPKFLDEAQNLINTHDANPSAHAPLHAEIGDLDARLTTLELMYSTDVNGNPFTITFQNLNGLTVEGIYNSSERRIEF